MSEPGSPDLRIGDAEREEALKALGEHMSVGRLTVDEYGERAAQVTAARTRGELTRLFTDLPQPHPILDQPLGKVGSVLQPQPEQTAVARRGARQRPATPPQLAALVPLSGLLAIVLFFAVPGMSWIIFLLPAAMAVIVGSLSQRR